VSMVCVSRVVFISACAVCVCIEFGVCVCMYARFSVVCFGVGGQVESEEQEQMGGDVRGTGSTEVWLSQAYS
jgi:hypothetical protein